ncbi:ADM_HP2_G0029610.mRNA.1.CDS.1 [Saccharomyces cerevisiae]|nr:BTE_HP_G0070670.mRNA.1.CDS.1 [Saccharomyces cerevisiae]CAI5080450.1 BTE_HP_G0102190.mRNA.1.CDS.1 [Saccharomyces cerevisiae]CAI5219044.1 BTE_HP_G0193270.mRNA.1.CDS.1 [Saccharomyces cerevisiae]CAI5308217.1 ADM_HP2_G0029610.mRNA.1.CDS.1 [Saccharomyces cerevisiae]CAI6670416.1 ADM_HP2_G0029610.mRNA.1.CDS.1 [Saccharomyces cerevisiae]
MKLFILDYEKKRTKIGKGMARRELKMMNKKPDLYTFIVSYFSIFSLFFFRTLHFSVWLLVYGSPNAVKEWQ